jgi:hypothetical protein
MRAVTTNFIVALQRNLDVAAQIYARRQLSGRVVVDHKLANVQPSYHKIIEYQRAHAAALQRECAYGKTSDGERTKRGSTHRKGTERNSADCRRTEWLRWFETCQRSLLRRLK